MQSMHFQMDLEQTDLPILLVRVQDGKNCQQIRLANTERTRIPMQRLWDAIQVLQQKEALESLLSK